MTTTIYHNPRCSKSRAALELLNSKGMDPEIVNYLEHPPTEAELRRVIKLLGIEPQQLVRQKEKLYQELKLDDRELTSKEWIKVLVENPKLIERPIVIHNNRAAIGRPIENVLEILR